MKKLTYSLSAALLALSILPWQSAHAAEETTPVTPIASEITVQTEANFTNNDEVNSFVMNAARNHVSTINMSVKQDSDVNGYSGFAFYNSEIAPAAVGYEEFDALAAVIEKAHEYGIQVRAWIPQFQDKAAINVNSSWQMRSIDDNGRIFPYSNRTGRSNYVNPFDADVQNYERSIIKEVVKNYNVDGVVLSDMDFDSNRVDMNTSTVSLFRQSHSFNPEKIDFTKSRDRNKVAQWNEWTSEQLANYIKTVSEDIRTIKPDLIVGVMTDSTSADSTSPNVTVFSPYVNFILTPANYKEMGHSPEWVYNKEGAVAQAKAAAANNVTIIPSLNVDMGSNATIQVYNGLRSNYPEINTVNYYMTGKYLDSYFSNIGMSMTY